MGLLCSWHKRPLLVPLSRFCYNWHMVKLLSAHDIRSSTAVSILTDLLSILLAIWLWVAATARFRQTNGLNAAIIGGVFALFCIGVYWLKKIRATETAVALPLSINQLRLLGIATGLALALGLAHQFGYFQAIQVADDRVLGAGESAAFFVYAPGAWLGAGLFYMLILSSTTPMRYAASDRWRVGLGLFFVNAMAFVTAVETTAVFTSSTWRGSLTLLLMLLLFLPPRLIYQQKQGSRQPLLSFGIYLLILVVLAIWR